MNARLLVWNKGRWVEGIDIGIQVRPTQTARDILAEAL